jgi:hypothetical protein
MDLRVFLFEGLETRPPQAHRLRRLGSRFQNHVAGEQREGALTGAVTSKFSGATSSPANDQAPLAFFHGTPPHRSLDWQIFELLSAPPSILITRGCSAWGMGVSLLPFSPQLAIFGRPTRHQRASTPGFEHCHPIPLYPIVDGVLASGERLQRHRTGNSTPSLQSHSTAIILPDTETPGLPEMPNSDPSTEEHGPTSAS